MLLFAYRLAKELGQPDPRAMLRGMSTETFRGWMALNRIDWENHMKEKLNAKVSRGPA